jgi:hypothetical protein
MHACSADQPRCVVNATDYVGRRPASGAACPDRLFRRDTSTRRHQ